MSEPLENLKILIIVPAYNEEKNIQNTINEIKKVKRTVDILVVNDGSSDATSLKANETGISVVNLPFNLGIGAAVQTGFKYAHKNHYDIAVQVDGDSQHDLDFLDAILLPVLNNEADFTIGSRFIPPFLGYQSSFVRRIGINFFAWLISHITEYKVTDPTSGFRAYNKKMIEAFARYYPQDYPEPEAIVVALRYRARVKEIPVKMRKRAGGVSSIRYLRTLYYMVKVTLAILLEKLKKSK